MLIQMLQISKMTLGRIMLLPKSSPDMSLAILYGNHMQKVVIIGGHKPLFPARYIGHVFTVKTN